MCFILANGTKNHKSRQRSGNSDRERDEIEAISQEMLSLARELESTSKNETLL